MSAWPPPQPLRAALFDYGNVLAAIDAEAVAARIAARGGVGDAAAVRAALPAAYRAHDLEVMEGGADPGAWRRIMGALVRAAWGPDVRVSDVEPAIDAIWEAHLQTTLWSDVPDGARHLLRDLATLDVPTGVVSNAEGQVRSSAERAGLAQLVRVVVDSAVVGIAKPDPRIFQIGADAIGVPLRETVYVGDSESTDVRGAHAAGAYAIRFDGLVANASPSGADAVAKSYAVLRRLLGQGLRIDLGAPA